MIVAVIPVFVHEQALEELLPVRREIQQVLCNTLPMSGEVDLPELHMCFLGMCTGTKEAVGAVNTFGENVAKWRRHRDTRQIVDSAWKCAWKFQYLATLRHDPLLMKAEGDVRQVLLAVIDRILREVLDWIECYENIVRHPEAWQGKDAHLMLVIEAYTFGVGTMNSKRSYKIPDRRCSEKAGNRQSATFL